MAASASGTAFLASALALALTEEVCDDHDVLDTCDERDMRKQQPTFDTLSSGHTSIELIALVASIPVSQISKFSSNRSTFADTNW